MVAWAPALTFCQHLKGKVTTYLRPEGPGQDHDDITCFSGFLIFFPPLECKFLETTESVFNFP